MLTVDSVILGYRRHDLTTSFIPVAHGVGMQVGQSDPEFMAKHGSQPITDFYPPFPYQKDVLDARAESGDAEVLENMRLGKEWMMEVNNGVYRTWEDLKFIRDNWDGPLILKGIQRVKDAELCIKHGVDGIIVSNHGKCTPWSHTSSILNTHGSLLGGRQADGAIPSLYALRNIMRSPIVKEAQVSGKFTVLMDSGIRTGSDIIKAVALGAQAVLSELYFFSRRLYGLILIICF